MYLVSLKVYILYILTSKFLFALGFSNTGLVLFFDACLVPFLKVLGVLRLLWGRVVLKSCEECTRSLGVQLRESEVFSPL